MTQGQHDIHREVCPVCLKEKYLSQMVSMSHLQKPLRNAIERDHPEIPSDGYVCLADLNRLRAKYVDSLIQDEIGELSRLDREVAQSIVTQETMAQNLNDQFSEKLTFGDRIADQVASFGGSWKFIIFFGFFIIIWIIVNSIFLLTTHFDPYPFILLNLILSCLAALQAPVIMMSQNRQEAKDRLRSEHDYKTNLKAELEIRILNEKLDHLMSHQIQSLMETQQILFDMIEENAQKKVHPKDEP